MNNITSETLENIWIKSIKAILKCGLNVQEENPFTELRNLSISYNNAFDLSCKNYTDIYGHDYLDYMQRVYSANGDKESGRDYHSLIYSRSGTDQVAQAIKLLKKDPQTRSAIITLSDPTTPKKPCVLNISFSIRNNFVNMSVYFKSSDIAKKFIPDMVEISKIHKHISEQLHIPRGSVSATILCAQLYQTDLILLQKIFSKVKHSSRFKTDAVIENWDKEARNWDKYLKDPKHYVNYENGYSRYVNFLKTNIPPAMNGAVALDSGSGTGHISEILNEKGYKTIGVDISPKMLEHSHKDPSIRSYVLANSLDIPFGDNHFDIICSRGVLISHVGKECVIDFIEEHRRVLKKGGLFMFDFITHFEKTEKTKRKKKAYFTYSKVTEILKESGFKIISRNGEDINRVNAILCQKI